MSRLRAWLHDPALWLEAFLIFNLGFLALDVFLAHRLMQHAPVTAWIPFAFSLAAPLALTASVAVERFGPRSHGRPAWARWIGSAVGLCSCAVGGAGVVLHLSARFADDPSLAGLVYSAPFSAPLAYTGLGLLAVLNRWVDAKDPAWSRWVLLFAAGGLMGNFSLTLVDHAQNGFFSPLEWVSVATSAFAATLVAVAAHPDVQGWARGVAWSALAVNAGAGLLGFGLHLNAIHELPGSLWTSILYGAPIFAPLLFVDLSLLGAIGLVAAPKGGALSR